jgi:hypothetical protein
MIRPATFQEALIAAQECVGQWLWNEMNPSKQTQAIYREMRRIDSERVAVVIRPLARRTDYGAQ